MLDIGVSALDARTTTLALPVRTDADGVTAPVPTGGVLPEPLRGELGLFLADIDRAGAPGAVNVLPRPGRRPAHVLTVGVGEGDEAAWRSAGAALARTCLRRFATVALHLPKDADTEAFAEGAWLATYQFRLAQQPPSQAVRLRRLVLATDDPQAVGEAIARARAVAQVVMMARDLTNTPSLQKSPRWFAERIKAAAARRSGLTVVVRDEAALAREGFGGLLAVGAGSVRPPRLIEVAWRPRGARTHVVLVGKGITFDSGGISIKPVDGMKLMRKDMGGAAAVCGAVLGAADLGIPVRVTAVAPLAENMISGSAVRPGDVVRHYGGLTTEVLNTDAEGRVVLGDALAYAVRKLRPDVIVDLATLTGASHVALGKRTAALFSEDDELAAALAAAGNEVGEQMWRLPLADEYVQMLASDVADLANSPVAAEAGAVAAALYLREFTGGLRARWAHIDMSAPAWIETHEGPLVKGATGWGVRMLLRWLTRVAAG